MIKYFCVIDDERNSICGVGLKKHEACCDAVEALIDNDDDIYDYHLKSYVVPQSYLLKNDMINNNGKRYGFKIKICSDEIYYNPQKFEERYFTEKNGYLESSNMFGDSANDCVFINNYNINLRG